MTTSVLVLEKIESDDKKRYATFYLHSKPETVINESDISDVFKQSILQLYQAYKNL